MRAFCNGRSELPSLPQIYGVQKRHISEVLGTFSNFLAGEIKFLASGSRAVNTFAHHERCEAKGLMWEVLNARP